MSQSLEPDYPDYSMDELQDALTHINRDRYPARFQRLLKEIESRRTASAAPGSPRPT